MSALLQPQESGTPPLMTLHAYRMPSARLTPMPEKVTVQPRERSVSLIVSSPVLIYLCLNSQDYHSSLNVSTISDIIHAPFS